METKLQFSMENLDLVKLTHKLHAKVYLNFYQPLFSGFPFELPEIPTLKKVQKRLLNKRKDEVMKYMTSSDLSKKQN